MDQGQSGRELQGHQQQIGRRYAHSVWHWLTYGLPVFGAMVFMVLGVVMVDMARVANAEGVAIWYSTAQAEHERNQVIIDPEGNLSAIIESSRSSSTPSGIGWYGIENAGEDPDIVEIRRFILNKGLDGEPNLSAQMRAGMRMTKFLIVNGDRHQVHAFDSMVPLPGPLAELEALVRPLYKRLQAHPLRVASLDISFEPVEVSPGDELRVVLVFRSLGQFPVELRNFLGERASLHINLWRSQKNEKGENEVEFALRIDLDNQEFLTAPRTAISRSEPVLKLGAGSTLKAWTTIKFGKVEPESYKAEAIYYSQPLSDEEKLQQPDLVVGEYHAALANLVVVAN